MYKYFITVALLLFSSPVWAQVFQLDWYSDSSSIDTYLYVQYQPSGEPDEWTYVTDMYYTKDLPSGLSQGDLGLTNGSNVYYLKASDTTIYYPWSSDGLTSCLMLAEAANHYAENNNLGTVEQRQAAIEALNNPIPDGGNNSGVVVDKIVNPASLASLISMIAVWIILALGIALSLWLVYLGWRQIQRLILSIRWGVDLYD